MDAAWKRLLFLACFTVISSVQAKTELVAVSLDLEDQSTYRVLDSHLAQLSSIFVTTRYMTKANYPYHNLKLNMDPYHTPAKGKISIEFPKGSNYEIKFLSNSIYDPNEIDQLCNINITPLKDNQVNLDLTDLGGCKLETDLKTGMSKIIFY